MQRSANLLAAGAKLDRLVATQRPWMQETETAWLRPNCIKEGAPIAWGLEMSRKSIHVLPCAGLALILWVAGLQMDSRVAGQTGDRDDVSVAFDYERSVTIPSAEVFAPIDIAIDSFGQLYIADALNSKIHVFSDAGVRVSEISRTVEGGAGASDVHLTPLALEADPESGTVYIVWGSADKAQANELVGQFKPIELQWIDRERIHRSVPVTKQWGRFLDLSLVPGMTPFPDTSAFLFAGFYPADGEPSFIRGLYGTRHFFAPDLTRQSPRVAAVDAGSFLVAGLHAEGVAQYDFEGNALEFWHTPSYQPVAIDSQDEFAIALVRQLNEASGSHGLILEMDLDGVISNRLVIENVPSPPPSGWPWTIIATDKEYAWTTANSTFQVVRSDKSGLVRHRIFGAETQGSYLPTSSRSNGHKSMLSAISAFGDVSVVADSAGSRIHIVDSDDRIDATMPGIAAIDIDLGPDAVNAISSSGDLLRIQKDDGRWVETSSTKCDCSVEARVATGASRLLVSRPSHSDIIEFRDDGVSMVLEPFLSYTEDIGGAADLDVLATGEVVTVHTSTRGVEHRSETGQLIKSWPLGKKQVPLRVAAGDWGDGPVVVVLSTSGHLTVFELESARPLTTWRPIIPGSTAISVRDIAFSGNGAILLADQEGQIHRFMPSLQESTPTQSPVTPTPSATPTQVSASRCDVSVDKVLFPSRILLGETSVITMSVIADCPGASAFDGADVVLAIDNSASMERQKLRDAINVGIQIESALIGSDYRLGLVTFSDTAQHEIQLGTPGSRVAKWAANLEAKGRTNLSKGLDMAGEMLIDTKMPNRLPLVVMITDGFGNFGGSASSTAARLHAEGLSVAAVAIGEKPDRDQLNSIVSERGLLYDEKKVDVTAWFTREFLGRFAEGWGTQWKVLDALQIEVDYVEGSAQPAAFVNARQLSWERPALPRSGLVVSYRLRPKYVGAFPTSKNSALTFEDVDGTLRSLDFPETTIEVLRPTATLTPTVAPTATTAPTSTPRLQVSYLPVLLRESCTPSKRRVDVMLLFDASSSMLQLTSVGRTKLEAAREAASRLLGELRLDAGDQLGVIAFNETITQVVSLTSDAPSLERAIATIETAAGTCIPCAISRASTELAGPTRKVENTGAIVLLTDGKSTVRPIEEAIYAARQMRDEGIEIFVVGLGQDIEDAALRAIASRPTFYRQTLDAETLAEILKTIVKEIPCTGSAFWGR